MFDGILNCVDGTQGNGDEPLRRELVLMIAKERLALDDKVVKPERILAFKAADIVMLEAVEVGMFQDETSSGPVRNKGRVEADTEIEVADRSRLGKERELVAATAWLDGGKGAAALEASSSVAYKPGWDQFAVNEKLTGTQSNYSDVSTMRAGAPLLRTSPAHCSQLSATLPAASAPAAKQRPRHFVLRNSTQQSCARRISRRSRSSTPAASHARLRARHRTMFTLQRNAGSALWRRLMIWTRKTGTPRCSKLDARGRNRQRRRRTSQLRIKMGLPRPRWRRPCRRRRLRPRLRLARHQAPQVMGKPQPRPHKRRAPNFAPQPRRLSRVAGALSAWQHRRCPAWQELPLW